MGHKNNFADLFDKHMNEVGLSDSRLAWKIGVSRHTVYRWRIGEVKSPNCQNVLKAAQIMKLTSKECEELLHKIGCESILDDLTKSENRPIIPQAYKPIFFPHHFFGREAVLKKVKWAWDHNGLQNIALIGPRSSGKTSLLHYLEEMSAPKPQLRPDQPKGWKDWRPTDIQFAVIDFHDPNMYQLDILFHDILQQLKLTPPFEEGLEGFTNKLKRMEQPTVIMIDEINAGLSAPTIDDKFWYSMRHVCSYNPYLSLLVTARKSVEELALDSGKPSPFFNLFGNIKLEPFTEREARELLDHLPSEVCEADKTWILETSQRWPAPLQQLCDKRLFALEQDEPEKDWKSEGLEAIEKLLFYLNSSQDKFQKPTS